MSQDTNQDPNSGYPNLPYGVPPPESYGPPQVPSGYGPPPQGAYGIPPQGPYGQPQIPSGYAAPPQGAYGTFPYQQQGYAPPVQAAPLPFGEAIRQLPRQYLRVLTKWSATTYAEEQSKASWGMVWLQMALIAILGIVNVYLPVGSTSPVTAILAGIIVVPLVNFLLASLYYLLARAFGGRGTWVAHLYCWLLITVLLSVVLIPFNAIPVLVGFGRVLNSFSLWLTFLMLKGVHGLSGGKAWAVLLIPVGVIVVIAVLVVIATSS